MLGWLQRRILAELVFWGIVCWCGFLPSGCYWLWKLYMPRTSSTVVPYALHLSTSIGFKLRRWHADRSGQTPIWHGCRCARITLCIYFARSRQCILSQSSDSMGACCYKSASQLITVWKCATVSLLVLSPLSVVLFPCLEAVW